MSQSFHTWLKFDIYIYIYILKGSISFSVKMDRKSVAISSFNVLLFPERKKTVNIVKKVPFMEIVPWLRVLFVSGSLGSEVVILIWKTCSRWWWPNWNADKNNPNHMYEVSQKYSSYFMLCRVLENTWIRESLRCLGASRNSFHGPHFHL